MLNMAKEFTKIYNNPSVVLARYENNGHRDVKPTRLPGLVIRGRCSLANDFRIDSSEQGRLYSRCF